MRKEISFAETKSPDEENLSLSGSNSGLFIDSPTQQIKSRTIEEENADFIRESRLGGSLSNQGISTDIVENPFLKVAEKAVHNSTSFNQSASFTREAQMIEINHSLLKRSSEADFEAMSALTNDKDEIDRFRRKQVDYGNHNAMHEVISQKLYSLTGMHSPDTKMMVAENETRENGALKISIISPMVLGYKDLGDFLIDNTAKRFIEPKNHDQWREIAKEIKKINDQESTTAEDKTKRIKLMSEVYDMLPDYFHNEIEKSFAASKFIANWDFANFNLNNIGCTFESKNGKIISFRSSFVDFGNSGVLGFGGKYKELSLERANTEAKTQHLKPNDYDPALKLTKEENELISGEILKWITQDSYTNKTDITLKKRLTDEAVQSLSSKLQSDNTLSEEDKNLLRTTISMASEGFQDGNSTMQKELLTVTMINICFDEDLSPSANKIRNHIRRKAVNNLFGNLINEEASATKNETLIRSILFKESHHIQPEDAAMELNPEITGFLTISDLPRNSPFALLFKNALKQKVNAALESEFSENNPLSSNKEFYRDSEIEMAFRISLIPDAAISNVMTKWDLREEYPQIFAMPTNLEHPEKYQGEELANIFKQRKNALTQLVPSEVINDWISRNIVKAITAEEEVKAAIIAQTDNHLSIDEKNSIASRELPHTEQCLSVLAVRKIMESITAKKDEILKNQESSKEEITQEKEDLLSQITSSRIALERLNSAESAVNSASSTMLETEKYLKSEIQEMKEKFDKDAEKSTNKLLLKFIHKNCDKWNGEISGSDPSYNLFDLKRISKIVKAASKERFFKRSESDMSFLDFDDDSSEDSAKDNVINPLILEEFIKILDKISNHIQNKSIPANAVTKTSSNLMTNAKHREL